MGHGRSCRLNTTMSVQTGEMPGASRRHLGLQRCYVGHQAPQVFLSMADLARRKGTAPSNLVIKNE